MCMSCLRWMGMRRGSGCSVYPVYVYIKRNVKKKQAKSKRTDVCRTRCVCGDLVVVSSFFSFVRSFVRRRALIIG